MKTRRNDNVVWLSPCRRLRRPARRKGPGAPAFAEKILETENRKRDWKLGMLVMLSTFLIGLIVVVVLPGLTPEGGWSTIASIGREPDPEQPRMPLCGTGRRINCVVDGDTIWLRGQKIRIADIDTPEIGEPKCQSEYALGVRAKHRLRVLLNKGPWSVERIGFRDEDKYGRKLRVLTRNGRSIGDMLVEEGLARTWSGRREPWC